MWWFKTIVNLYTRRNKSGGGTSGQHGIHNNRNKKEEIIIKKSTLFSILNKVDIFDVVFYCWCRRHVSSSVHIHRSYTIHTCITIALLISWSIFCCSCLLLLLLQTFHRGLHFFHTRCKITKFLHGQFHTVCFHNATFGYSHDHRDIRHT